MSRRYWKRGLVSVVIAAGSAVGLWAGMKLGGFFGLTGWPLLASGALGALIPQLTGVRELTYSDGRISGKWGEIYDKAEDAIKLAELAAQSALLLSHLPRGAFFTDGYEKSGNAVLRTLLVNKFRDLDFDDKEIDKLMRFEDPHIAKNILNSVVRNRADRYLRENPENASQFWSDFLPLMNDVSENNIPLPSLVRSVILKHDINDHETLAAVDAYRQWYEAPLRFKFVLEHEAGLHAIRSRQSGYTD